MVGGEKVLPTVPCDGLLRKIHEENYLLENFNGMLKHVVSWDKYRLGNDRIVEELEEQKARIEKALNLIKGAN